MFSENDPFQEESRPQDPQATTPLPSLEDKLPTRKKEVLLAVGILVFCMLTAIGNWVYGIRAKPASPKSESSFAKNLFQEEVDLGIILVEGTIMHSSGSGGFGGGNNGSSDRLIAAIRQAEKDKVKGILFKINSPGGTAAASQAVYHEIQRVRKESNIKVVAAMGDVAASGGYYIACAADKIYANPATLTGSIGVISQFTKVQGLFEKLGLEATVIKSGAYKDMGSPFRETTVQEKDILQAIIDDTYLDFIQSVAAGRNLDLEVVRKLADGRIYTGNQALKHKMVDALGDYQTAMEALKKITKSDKSAKIKNYSKANIEDIFGMLGTKVENLSPTASLEHLAYSELRQLNKIPLMLYY